MGRQAQIIAVPGSARVHMKASLWASGWKVSKMPLQPCGRCRKIRCRSGWKARSLQVQNIQAGGEELAEAIFFHAGADATNGGHANNTDYDNSVVLTD